MAKSASEVSNTYWGYRQKHIKQKRVGGKWVSWDTRTDQPADHSALRAEFSKKGGEFTPWAKKNRMNLALTKQSIGNRLVYDEQLDNRGRLQTRYQANLADINKEEDMIQAFNKAKNRDRTVKQNTQFPNPRQKSLDEQLVAEAAGGSTNQVPTKVVETAERKNNMNEVVTAPGPTTSYLNEWNTDMPIDAKSVKVEGSDLPNRGTLKSDVFTLGKDGLPLGVMTRAQRRKWDADPKNQALMQQNIAKLKIQNRTYGSGNIGTGSG